MENLPKTVSGKRGILRQYIAGCSANLATMTAGCVLGWTSPVLPKLALTDSFIHPTAAQGSWIGSLVPLGAAIGPYLGGYLADKIGRKWTMLASAIPFLLGWILITTAQNITMIYIARFISGFGIGTVYAVAPMYAGEIAEDSVRGSLGSLLNVLVSAGFLYEYIIGPYVSYIWLGIISMIVPITFAVSFFFMPESPYYLLIKGKKEEASKSLQWLRDFSEKEVEKEMEEIQNSVDEANKNSGSFKDLVSTRGNVKALYLSLGLIWFQVVSGIDAVLFYSTTIFLLADGSISGDVSSIIVGVVMFLFAIVAPLIVDHIGRKPLLYISAVGMAISEFALGTYFYLNDEKQTDLSAFGWIPVTSLVIYIAVYSIGYGPIPWAIVGELFSSNVKGVAAASTASFCWFVVFFLTKYFQNLVDAVGMYAPFWLFASFCVLANPFVFFFLPETKGKSLEEILDMLNKKN